MSRRSLRVADLLKQEVSDIIRNEMKDPRIGFVTVTAVDVTDDLRYARVFVSVFGSDAERTRSLQGLERATGFIRSQIGRRVRLRHTPEFSFRFDRSLIHAARIAEVMKTIQPVDGAPAPSDGEDAHPASPPVEDAEHG
ncbi:MAG: 30S ribosome-binding factor RbfA [Candidatus Latescibacteria bacterium]|nr:30S ribosome-binding factor RbfA [Candidatus Latescibacterota bacterium]